MILFCRQETAYEVRISDLSSDVCSSDVDVLPGPVRAGQGLAVERGAGDGEGSVEVGQVAVDDGQGGVQVGQDGVEVAGVGLDERGQRAARSEEHTSELQSLMRTSYAVFSFKKQ